LWYFEIYRILNRFVRYYLQIVTFNSQEKHCYFAKSGCGIGIELQLATQNYLYHLGKYRSIFYLYFLCLLTSDKKVGEGMELGEKWLDTSTIVCLIHVNYMLIPSNIMLITCLYYEIILQLIF
jgi:hypothetical protein